MTTEQSDRLTALFDDHAQAINDEAVAYETFGRHNDEYQKARKEAIRIRLEFVNLLAEISNG